MNTSGVSLILTVIGDDRPGLVERLSSVVSQHQGNWLESSMSHLSGKFAGIVRMHVTRPGAYRIGVDRDAWLDIATEGGRLGNT